MINKNAMGLPINIVVTMIIGLTIFGLGMGLFSKISGSAGDQVDDLQNQIKNDIAALECQGDEWICSPNNKMKNGGEETFQLYIANHNDEKTSFRVNIELEDVDGKQGLTKDSCGSVIISSLSDFEVTVKSGFSASVPFIVKATRVSNTPCSFVTTATLEDVVSGIEEKTAVIIRVE